MLNVISQRCHQGNRASILGFILFCSLPMSVSAQGNKWTLASSIERVVAISPEMRAAAAEVNIKEGALQQAGAWPNPEVELRIDNKIAKDQGSNGADFTQFSFSQPLPLSGRIGLQQSIAESELYAAQAQRFYQRLKMERQVAQRYHALQLASERLQLTEQRLVLAKQLQSIGQRRNKAGELSALEQLRLDLIRESAQQIVAVDEGVYDEALANFSSYLDLSSLPEVEALKAFNTIPSLQLLQQQLSQHALLIAARHRVAAARSTVDLSKAERLADPRLKVFYEQDMLNGREQSVLGIGVGITLPLWDQKKGRINEAQARVVNSQSEVDILTRDLSSRLQQSYQHLNHLVEQGEHYRSRVLQPAQQVFELTNKAYASGELEILSLIDANNTYFNVHERYLELLQNACLEAAELRFVSGQILSTNTPGHLL